MIAVVQRVSAASVVVEGKTVGAISRGLAVLVGIHQADTAADLEWLAGRLVGLRIFADGAGKMNLAIGQITGRASLVTAAAPPGILLVPNFTLCAQAGKGGNRPSFVEAKAPGEASAMFKALVDRVKALVSTGSGDGVAAPIPHVATGVFAADMAVSIINDGPITIVLDSARR